LAAEQASLPVFDCHYYGLYKQERIELKPTPAGLTILSFAPASGIFISSFHGVIDQFGKVAFFECLDRFCGGAPGDVTILRNSSGSLRDCSNR